MATPIRDRGLIERYLRRHAELHVYEIGDLDPFFWPHTRWLGTCGDDGELRALALLYSAIDPPTLLAFDPGDEAHVAGLLEGVRGELPGRVYSHLSPGLHEVLTPRFRRDLRGRFHKMALRDPAGLEAAADAGATEGSPQPLGHSDLDELLELFGRAYPGNWFDPRMLETGHYLGIRQGGRLVAVAGIHVYSRRHRVAALGNVTTAPEFRGRGLARRATAALCRRLAPSVDVIGLNVQADNVAAVALYRRLGFEVVAPYEEAMLEDSSEPVTPARE